MNRDNHDKQMLKALQQVASEIEKEFKEKCLKVADENWTLQHIAMLERLFKAVETGEEYKCIGCHYFGRAVDAPETVPNDCMWQPNDCDEYRPCEDD